ncbi:MAG: hypothetical protein GC186_10130 [Rhodobacteraceae bacterium]|nr:hypothetical protein [Paracoccaceae bacterium]
MAYDEGLAQLIREDLEGLPGITEKKMFGGLCFLMHGNMVCGVLKGGAIFRIGKANDAAARALPGVGDMTFTGKPMASMVQADAEATDDDATRAALMAMSVATARALPPK